MPSHIEWVREFCLALPHTTEDIQWGNDLLFRIAKKIYCVVCLDPNVATKLAFKCTPEKFAELVEVEGVIPAPYMARNHWVALERYSALPWRELQERITRSYELVKATLPKKLQAALSAGSIKPQARKRRAASAEKSRSKARL